MTKELIVTRIAHVEDAMNPITDIEPICEADGKAHSKCQNCDTTINDNIAITMTGHDYGEFVLEFSEDGKTCTAVKTCVNDSIHKIKEACTITSAVKTPATCTDDAGAVFTDTKDVADIPALGHNYTSAVTKQLSTSEEGVRTYTCSNCKDTYTEAIPKLEALTTQATTQAPAGGMTDTEASTTQATTENNTDSNVATGDNTPIMALVMMLMMYSAGLVFMGLKRKEK